MSKIFNKFQKISQSIIIWLLPLFGALLILYVINDNDRKPPPPRSDQDTGGGDSIAGVS